MHQSRNDHDSLHGFSVPFRFLIHFTQDCWNPDNRLIVNTIRRLEPERRHRALVVIDDRVAAAHPWLFAQIDEYFAAFPEFLCLVAPPVVMTGGEVCKNDLTAPLAILQKINELGLDRQSFIIAIGGGAILDMVSFAAALAHRGVRIVRLPTTVLSQGDSGVGVKNGINLFGKKNFLGTFVPPFAVVNDAQFLSSLEQRDRISGVSEAVKVALLKDPDFYNYLEAHAGRIVAGDPLVLTALIRRSALLHVAHICGNGDPFELGSARPLDFGHWAAHKLESMTAHRLRHGEAVAIGMALDLAYSVAMGYLHRACADRILRLLEAIGFALWDDALVDRDTLGRLTLVRGLQEFREHLGGELHVTLLRGIGEGFEVTEMDETVVADSIAWLAARQDTSAPAPHLFPAGEVERG